MSFPILVWFWLLYAIGGYWLWWSDASWVDDHSLSVSFEPSISGISRMAIWRILWEHEEEEELSYSIGIVNASTENYLLMEETVKSSLDRYSCTLRANDCKIARKIFQNIVRNNENNLNQRNWEPNMSKGKNYLSVHHNRCPTSRV